MKPGTVGSLSPLPQKRKAAAEGHPHPQSSSCMREGATLASSPVCCKWGLRPVQKGSLQVAGRAAEAPPPLAAAHPAEPLAVPVSSTTSGKCGSCGVLRGEAGFSGHLPPPACLPSPKTP